MIEIAALIIVVFLLLLLSMVWPPDSPWAPWWKISKNKSLSLIKSLPIKKSDIVYELGSGDGEFILTVSQKVNVKKAIGIEIDPIRYVQSNIRKYIHNVKAATFIKKNFFDVDISDATVVFTYLVPRALGRLLPKLKKELQKNAVLISYRYQIPQEKKKILKLYKHDKENEFYIYKKV